MTLPRDATLILLLTSSVALSEGVSWRRVLDQPDAWYTSAEARRIAENVLAHQHPNGGWPKNVDMTVGISADQLQRVRREAARAQTTIDNGATHTQVRLLARVHRATGEQRCRDAALQGIDFLLDAQYDNGGWPQFYPPRRGYYSHITFNDGAMIGVLRLMRDASQGQGEWSFVGQARRERCALAVEHGVEVILKSQVRIDSERTVWCAQHDEHTLAPAKARSYELPSLSGYESVGIVQFLMEIDEPSPAVIRAIQAAVAWFERARIEGLALQTINGPDGRDRIAVAEPGARPLWARFYNLRTGEPIFVGRDGVVHDDYNQIERERRLGYNYLGAYAERLLAKDYPRWRKRVEPTDP